MKARGIDIPMLVASLFIVGIGVYTLNIQELTLYSTRRSHPESWTIGSPYKDILGWVLVLAGSYSCYRAISLTEKE